MLRNIRCMRRATFLKSRKILNSETYLAPKSFGLWTVDCGPARQQLHTVRSAHSTYIFRATADVLTASVTNNRDFWDVTCCQIVNMYRPYFGLILKSEALQLCENYVIIQQSAWCSISVRKIPICIYIYIYIYMYMYIFESRWGEIFCTSPDRP